MFYHHVNADGFNQKYNILDTKTEKNEFLSK